MNKNLIYDNISHKISYFLNNVTLCNRFLILLHFNKITKKDLNSFLLYQNCSHFICSFSDLIKTHQLQQIYFLNHFSFTN